MATLKYRKNKSNNQVQAGGEFLIEIKIRFKEIGKYINKSMC